MPKLVEVFQGWKKEREVRSFLLRKSMLVMPVRWRRSLRRDIWLLVKLLLYINIIVRMSI